MGQWRTCWLAAALNRPLLAYIIKHLRFPASWLPQLRFDIVAIKPGCPETRIIHVANAKNLF
jgi:hypothetical protein